MSRIGRMQARGRFVPTLGVLAMIMGAAAVLGGCAGGSLAEIPNAAEFERQVVQSDKPTLVMFTKPGCPPCLMVEPVLSRLAEEYEGRAYVTKFAFLTATFGVPSAEIKERYDIHWAPTVMLFVDGKPTGERWIANTDINTYRRALDAVVAPQPAATAAARPPAGGS